MRIMKRGHVWQTAAALLLLSLLPALLYWTWCTPERGCLALIHFGENFAQRALPEVQTLEPPTLSPWGYDGQFYAQIALDPTLRDPGLEQALDLPHYRARRIGLPALAAVLGVGDPLLTLQIYSVSNLLFWLMLAVLLVTRYPPDRLQHWLVYFALLWSTGVFYSMDRSVTDLPAATLGLLAICFGQRGGRWLMALSALTKETSLLSFIAVSGWRPVANPRVWWRSFGVLLLMTLPLLLWIGWVYLRFGQISSGQSGNFAWPGVALWSKLSTATSQLSGQSGPGLPLAGFRALELVAPLSLLVQSLYLLVRPDPRSTLWLYGIGFAVLFWLIGPPVWAEQGAYTRVLLPLTLSFNLLLLERRPTGFPYWFTAGNIGLCSMTLKISFDALMKAVN
jgi:hypothetical protein